MAYRQLQQHVAAFRDFLREQGRPTAEEQELLAAKPMGRWRSGATLSARTRERRSFHRRRPAAQQQFQLRENGSAGICRAARITYSPDEPRDTTVWSLQRLQ